MAKHLELTRYLYWNDEVKLSFIYSLLNGEDLNETLFWIYELYYSDYQEETFCSSQCFARKIPLDFGIIEILRNGSSNDYGCFAWGGESKVSKIVTDDIFLFLTLILFKHTRYQYYLLFTCLNLSEILILWIL